MERKMTIDDIRSEWLWPTIEQVLTWLARGYLPMPTIEPGGKHGRSRWSENDYRAWERLGQPLLERPSAPALRAVMLAVHDEFLDAHRATSKTATENEG